MMKQITLHICCVVSMLATALGAKAVSLSDFTYNREGFFEINTPEDMMNLSAYVNEGNTSKSWSANSTSPALRTSCPLEPTTATTSRARSTDKGLSSKIFLSRRRTFLPDCSEGPVKLPCRMSPWMRPVASRTRSMRQVA